MKLKFLALFISLLAAPSFAAVKKKVNLGLNLKKHKRELSTISREIFSIESNLGKGNKKYLKTLNKRKKMEEVIVKLEMKLNNERAITEKRYVAAKKRLRQVLVQGLGSRRTAGQLLGHSLVTKALKKEVRKLASILKKNKSLTVELNTSRKRYHNLREVESDLLGLIREMEETKRVKSLKYVEVKKIKDELQGKVKLKKAKKYVKKKKASAKIAERFSRPINSIVDMEYGKKGVTFKFDKRQEVKSSRAGKVIHTGSLSTYGNVVMVDHGNDVKSIYLGQFLPTVKKGQKLSAGTPIGKTFDVAKNEGKLYFEVRKKNKAQNTILLLDKNKATVNNQQRRRI